MNPLYLLLVVAIPAVAWKIRQLLQARRFRRLASERLAPELVDLLCRFVPLYDRLPEHLQLRLQGLVNVFLNDKNFFGSGGLEISDEMRLAVAGNACLLILNRDEPRFPGSRTILIYPDTFVSRKVTYDGPLVREGLSARLGESWSRGPVILSWADVLRGIEHSSDGHNVVIHEFAHKLDEENGPMDGLPVLHEQQDYAAWASTMTQEFAHLTARVRAHRNRVLDAYGSTSPAEFFAVVSEAFFEQGARLKQRLPALYELLVRYYGVEPAQW